ncbi:MAG TPA: hypothetical protein VFZ53_11625 [Polyangiaceae bacterium]
MTDPAPEQSAQALARERDKRLGLVIVLAAFVLAIGISAWAKHASRPETSEPPGPPVTKGVVGFPDRVDVIKTFAAARAMTKRTLFRGFVAEGVRSDGTIDVSEGPGRARYAFQSPPGLGPQPEREPGTLPRRQYCGKQDVRLRHEGLVLDDDKADATCSSRPLEPLTAPSCSLADIWRHALEKQLPGDRLARIEHYRARGGPAYRFELPEGHHFVLQADCRTELHGADATGRVP